MEVDRLKFGSSFHHLLAVSLSFLPTSLGLTFFIYRLDVFTGSVVTFNLLFIIRERGRKGEKGRETSCVRYIDWGPGQQPKHVP